MSERQAPGPTVQAWLQRRFIAMSRDAALLERLRAETPADWHVTVACDLAGLGDWHELLLYRFLLLDLDEAQAFDPGEVMRVIRIECMLQIAVFCFGGDRALRDEMRIARADRFFDRDEIVSVLPQFFVQYGWGR